MTSEEMFQKYLEEENRPKIGKQTIFQKIRNRTLHTIFMVRLKKREEKALKKGIQRK